MLLYVGYASKPQGMAGIGARSWMERIAAPTTPAAGSAALATHVCDQRNSGTVRPSGPFGGNTG